MQPLFSAQWVGMPQMALGAQRFRLHLTDAATIPKIEFGLQDREMSPRLRDEELARPEKLGSGAE